MGPGRRGRGGRAGDRHLLPADARARPRGGRHRGAPRIAAVQRRSSRAVVGGGATALWHWRRCAPAGRACRRGEPRRQPRHRRARACRRLGRRRHRARAATAARRGPPGSRPEPPRSRASTSSAPSRATGSCSSLPPGATLRIRQQDKAGPWKSHSSSLVIAAIFVVQHAQDRAAAARLGRRAARQVRRAR